MAWDIWYERSLRWDPVNEPGPEDRAAWWNHLGTLRAPTRLVISAAAHRALQHQPLTWPAQVRRVDTLIGPTTSPEGLAAWHRPPPSWGWLWRAPLRADTPRPEPLSWPDSPSFKAELIAGPPAWPHPGTWWLRWASDPARRTIPLEIWLDERQGMTPDDLVAWDRWQQQVGRLALGSGWPVKPWAQDADEEDDPRWNPVNHAVWTPEGEVPDTPFWAAPMPPAASGLTPAPCPSCAASPRCPGPYQPQRWATADGICTQGRSWRLEAPQVAREGA